MASPAVNGLALIAALALCTAVPIAQAAPAPELAPVSPWNVHYAEESCKLIRGFGTTGDTVTMMIEMFGPGDRGSVVLVGNRLRSDTTFQQVRVWFGADRPANATEAVSATGGSSNVPMVIASHIWTGRADEGVWGAEPDLAYEKSLDRVTYEAAGHVRFVLDTGRMDQPLTAMRKCVDGLVKEWGLDPAVQRTLTRRVVPATPPQTWIHDGDYPYVPLVDGASGIVHFRLNVGVDGIPTACVIQSKTKPDEFAPTTCRLLTTRARFQPARDAQGQPVASYFFSSVRYANRGRG